MMHLKHTERREEDKVGMGGGERSLINMGGKGRGDIVVGLWSCSCIAALGRRDRS